MNWKYFLTLLFIGTTSFLGVRGSTPNLLKGSSYQPETSLCKLATVSPQESKRHSSVADIVVEEKTESFFKQMPTTFHSYLPKVQEVTALEETNTGNQDLIQQDQLTDSSHEAPCKEQIPVHCSAVSHSFKTSFRITPKIGFFRPRSKSLRKIHGKILNQSLEAAMNLTHRISLWGDAFYLCDRGSTPQQHDPLTTQLFRLGGGLKFTANQNLLKPYLGLGLGWFHLDSKNKCPFVIQHTSRSTMGLILKSGVQISVARRFSVDFFLDWADASLKFNQNPNGVSRPRLQLGGTTAGIGLGGTF